MKKLSLSATKIFCRLLQKLGSDDYLKIPSDCYMPLSIEVIGTQVETPYGYAKLYAISHTYLLNGDLMRDPEMVFIVCDKRQSAKDISFISIYPQLYRQDNLGIYEESVTIRDNKATSYRALWQQDHCRFAAQWFHNIQQQGFLK